MTLSARIGVGLLLGTAVGLFLGEWAEPLRIVANGYVRLLQMTVLPYVMVSLVAGIGGLDPAAARVLLTRVSIVLLCLWALALGLVVVMPLAFPNWEAAAFFSTALLESPEPFDFISLYIPNNPFNSLANNVVPAVVFFSGLVGLALISVEGKQPLVLWLEIVARALAAVNRTVVKLSPIGLFAIAANLAGTIRLEELQRMQVYLLSYGVFAALLVFWLIPGLLRVVTPIGWRELFGATRDGLITALLTGELFVVLPTLSEASTQLVRRHAHDGEEAQRVSNVVVSASFSLPHAGKVLSLSFVLFAGWFAEAPVPGAEYPRFALTALLTSFGSLNAAVPYLLDLFRIPADTFNLFLATGLVNSRVGTAVAAMHAVALATAVAWAMERGFSIDRRRLLRFAAVSVLLVAGATLGLRFFFDQVVEHTYTGDQVLASMYIVRDGVPATVHREPVPPPAESAGATQLEQIRARGRLRVGYIDDALPYAFFNARGDLVGFDIEMAHRLAGEIGVALEFVPVDFPKIAEQLARGDFDLVMSGVAMTPRRAEAMSFSRPYLDEHVAFVMRDERRKEFTTQATVRALGKVRLGVLELPYYVDKLRAYAPEADVVPFETRSKLFDALSRGEIYAAVASAERGSAWTLLHPEFSVSVPQPLVLTIPLAYPVAHRDAALLSFLDSWIEIQQRAGSIEEARDYWVLGKNAENRAPRWSVLRDVLHWVN